MAFELPPFPEDAIREALEAYGFDGAVVETLREYVDIAFQHNQPDALVLAAGNGTIEQAMREQYADWGAIRLTDVVGNLRAGIEPLNLLHTTEADLGNAALVRCDMPYPATSHFDNPDRAADLVRGFIRTVVQSGHSGLRCLLGLACARSTTKKFQYGVHAEELVWQELRRCYEENVPYVPVMLWAPDEQYYHLMTEKFKYVYQAMNEKVKLANDLTAFQFVLVEKAMLSQEELRACRSLTKHFLTRELHGQASVERFERVEGRGSAPAP